MVKGRVNILVQSQNICVSIHEVKPAEFPNLCKEVHAVVKPELMAYLQEIVKDNRGAIFAACDQSGECTGRIEVEVHPGYQTRGKPCVLFGWLDGNSQVVVQALLDHVSQWSSRMEPHSGDFSHRINLLRGPISMPKDFGGIGCQTDGFHLPRMHSISTNRPELAEWIERAGFKRDAEYACIDMSNAPRWESAQLPPGFSIVYWTQDEWRAHELEVVGAFRTAFVGMFPDSSGPSRFHELIDTMSFHPNGKYLNPIVVGPKGEIAGMIICSPNLYEKWDGHPVTGVNVDTVFISPEHQKMGLYSSLNNVGRFNGLKYMNITYVEGTGIWLANENAVKAFFPHGQICRRHVVFQKRLKKGT